MDTCFSKSTHCSFSLQPEGSITGLGSGSQASISSFISPTPPCSSSPHQLPPCLRLTSRNFPVFLGISPP